jgi:predicted O-methyltransferase YrrM
MKFTLTDIKALITEALENKPIGIDFLDSRYDWYAELVQHSNPYYRLFYLIAQELNPNFVVELGSYRATAAAHFALGNPQSQVVTIDIHKDAQQADDKAACIDTVSQVKNLHYLNKWTWDAIEDIKTYKKKIDILFIDAWHREDYVKREWELFSPLLNNPALIICDDIFDSAGQFPGMVEWWNGFKYAKFLDAAVHPAVPMGFMRYEVKPIAKSRSTSKTKRTTKKTA